LSLDVVVNSQLPFFGGKMSKKEQSFEKSLLRLEEIVAQMEDADPDLDKALALFSEGSGLVKFCSQKLSEAKKKIEILVKDAGGIKKEEFKDE
jgi:exodeoxyribonuclease VII small subunit